MNFLKYIQRLSVQAKYNNGKRNEVGMWERAIMAENQ